MHKQHDTDTSSTEPESFNLKEEVANTGLGPAADEKEVEIHEVKEDTSNAIAFKEEAVDTCNLSYISMFYDILTSSNSRMSHQQAAEPRLALSEENEAASSAEDAQPGPSKDTIEETNPPLPVDVSKHSEEGALPIKEVQNSDEDPIPSEEVDLEIEHHARSTDTHLEDVDMKEDNTSMSDEGKEKGPFITEEDVEIKRQYVQDEPHTDDSNKHEEVACEESSTAIPEYSPMLPPEETQEANVDVYEAPEDDKKVEEIPMKEEKWIDATGISATESRQKEGDEDICMNSHLQSEEKIKFSEDEILMRKETEDITEQGKMDEPKVSDKNSSSHNVQTEESGETEAPPSSSEIEKTILEESRASKDADGELGEEYRPENAPVDSKPDDCIIEEVRISNF